MSSRLKLFAPFIVFIVVGVFLARGLSNDPSYLPSALIGKPMPAFSLPSLQESSQTLTKAIYEGKPYLVNIWGTWCRTCYYEHPYLVELAEQGVLILGVNWRDDHNEALKWLDRLENPYSHIVEDKHGRLVLDLGVTAAPETFVVDREGIIRYRHTGQLTPDVWKSHIAQYMY